jgi:hypothetical protein
MSKVVSMGKMNTEKQDQVEEIVNKTLKIFNVSTYKQTVTARLYEFMESISNRPISKAELETAIEEFGEKTVISYIFNSDRGSYYDTLKAFKDEKYEKELISQGLHPLYVSQEEAKLYHSEQHIGTHSQVYASHVNGVGSQHAQSGNTSGLVFDLFKSGVLTKLTAEGLMEYVFQEYNRVITKPIAEKITEEINKQRLSYENKMFTDLGDDKLTKVALRKVTKHCKEQGLSYETSNQLGQQTRKLIGSLESSLGREIGKIVIDEEDNASIVAKIAEKLCASMNVPVEDAGAILSKIGGKNE